MKSFKFAVIIVSVFVTILFNVSAHAQGFYNDPDYSTYGSGHDESMDYPYLDNRPHSRDAYDRGEEPMPVPSYEERNYERPFDPMDMPRLPTERDRFDRNRERMGEAVRELGLPDRDQDIIINHAVMDGGIISAEGLRRTELSDESWGQIRDDASFR